MAGERLTHVHMQETGALQSLFWLLPPKARATVAFFRNPD